jgi:hypothetical protein
MPQGTPFHGLIPPFPIRVDQFDASPGFTVVPALHLLSHTHSDHILGLSAKSFASTIICSKDAKQMLLRHEVYGERALRDVDLRDEARLSRTFGHLKIPPFLKDGKLDFSASRDLLVCYIYMQAGESLIDMQTRGPSLFTPQRKSNCVIISPSLSHSLMPIIVLVPSCTSRVCSKQRGARIFDSLFLGFLWKVFKALFFTPETSVQSHGFLMTYAATRSYNLILRSQRPKELCQRGVQTAALAYPYSRRWTRFTSTRSVY